MTDDMTIRNMSPNTEKACIRAVKNFSKHFAKSPSQGTLVSVRHSRNDVILWPDGAYLPRSAGLGPYKAALRMMAWPRLPWKTDAREVKFFVSPSVIWRHSAFAFKRGTDSPYERGKLGSRSVSLHVQCEFPQQVVSCFCGCKRKQGCRPVRFVIFRQGPCGPIFDTEAFVP